MKYLDYLNAFIINAGGSGGGGGYPEPTGTKNVSITQNGTTTENVKDFANAQITVNVPASASPVPAEYGTPIEKGVLNAEDASVYAVGYDSTYDCAIGTAPAVGTKLAYHAEIENASNVKVADFYWWGTVTSIESDEDAELDYVTYSVDGLNMNQTGEYPVLTADANGMWSVTGYNKVNIDYSDVVPAGYKVAAGGRNTPERALSHKIGETITVDCYEEEVGSRIAVGDLLATDIVLRSQSRPYVYYGTLWLWGTVTAVEDVAEYNLQRATIASVSGMAVKKTTEFPALTITANGTHDVTGMSQVAVNVPVGDKPTEAAIIRKELSGAYTNEYVTMVEAEMFMSNSGLTEVHFPNCTVIRSNAFSGAGYIKVFDMPKLADIGSYALQRLGQYLGTDEYVEANLPSVVSFSGARYAKFKELVLPVARAIQGDALRFCAYLEKLDLPVVNGRADNKIYAQAFDSCTNFTALILRNTTETAYWRLDNVSAFTGTPIANGTGYIYVPAALVATYQAATNWSTFAAQFRALEDYTVDGTTTGDLDPTKI